MGAVEIIFGIVLLLFALAIIIVVLLQDCLLYTSDAADE